MSKKIYIPKNLEDCFKELDKLWTNKEKNLGEQLSEERFLSDTHHGSGRWVKNNWGLWSGSRLVKYFNKLGVEHPDDMSSIIFTSWHRRLTGQEVCLEDQIKFYQEY